MRTTRKRSLACVGALALAVGAGVVGLAAPASAVTGTATASMHCQLPPGSPSPNPRDMNSTYTVEVPDEVQPGDVLPAGSVKVTPSPTGVTVPLQLTLTMTPSVTFELENAGIPAGTKVTVTGAVQDPQTVPANGEPSIAPWTNNAPITIPASASPGAIKWLADSSKTITTITNPPLGAQETTCTANAPKVAIVTNQIPVPTVPTTTKLTPNNGGPGTAVTATGVNFAPGPVTCTASLAGVDTDTGTGTADAAGNATCSLTVTTKADSIRIGATPGKAFVWVTPIEGVPHPVDIEVLPGALAIGPAGGLPTLDLGSITINGKSQTVTGTFNAAAVQDFRGGSLGWDVTVTRTPFLNTATGHAMNTAALTIAPTCAVTNPDSPSPCAVGAAGAITDTPKQVASQAPGGEELTGGEFAVGGGASLKLPPFMFADAYQSVVTFSMA
ncbi:hypothetical protein [Streptomyces mesophilus]|uniref:hypothetical protein n=1 Tax=Streptomyces mesophilus TaxID=1775132 RepID=UPI002E281630|nr:hypothetical protein [Streptomyces mesophilus]